MKKCKDCKFCKKSIIADYVKDADIYRCDIDNDVIFTPLKEGEDCAWFTHTKKQSNIIEKLLSWLFS